MAYRIPTPPAPEYLDLGDTDPADLIPPKPEWLELEDETPMAFELLDDE